MAHCYLCGSELPSHVHHVRRKVKTGEHVRKRYPRSGISATQSSYGMRIVCKRCARFLDRQDLKRDLMREWLVGLALIILILLFLYPNIGG
ncbi:MAG: hypothetical protein JST12_18595 [Armatimonadetes bacterium]|nr:hypothetical protein [Armatimonadota bacterium]